MSPSPDDARAMTLRFREVAERVVDALLEADPEWALAEGEPRGAHRLTDRSTGADVARTAMLTDALGSLDEIDPDLLDPADLVDLEVLRSRVGADLWHAAELRPHTWDPLVHSPGGGLLPLLEEGPLEGAERLAALASRWAALPDHLATARDRLSEGPGMPRVHVEAALERLAAERRLLTHDVPALAEQAAPSLKDAAHEAARALEEHESWLRTEREFATAEPRMGERAFAAQLWYSLDSELSPEALLVRAESDLLATEEALAEAAAEYQDRPRGSVRVAQVLESLGSQHPLTGSPSVDCERALHHLHRRTRESGIATVYGEPPRVVPLTEPWRGPATARCLRPGPLDARGADHPARMAVAPESEDAGVHGAPALRALLAREGVPGRALQLAHAARHEGPTRVRALLASGTFTEGWAAHAEQTLVGHGWGEDGGEPGAQAALRLAHLHARLRTVLDAILDVRVHTGDITEDEAHALLTERGHLSPAEAARTWRRARLTSARLSTPYVGHTEMAALVRDLADARPELSERERHDLVLGHGAPPPRHLRTLLGL